MSLKKYYFPVKRTIDLFVALGLLYIFLPLLFLISLAIKLSSPGPVFFKQRRYGLRGKEFTMYKFRTMVNNAEQLKSELINFNLMKGPVFKMKDDPRIFKFGKFLRRSSLDELPQLINVLKGQMSIVGPRPLPVSEITLEDKRQYERLKVKPGLTCLWQINGRSEISDFEEWLKLDLKYVQNCSIGLDLRIILKTIPAVLKGIGAY